MIVNERGLYSLKGKWIRLLVRSTSATDHHRTLLIIFAVIDKTATRRISTELKFKDANSTWLISFSFPLFLERFLSLSLSLSHTRLNTCTHTHALSLSKWVLGDVSYTSSLMSFSYTHSHTLFHSHAHTHFLKFARPFPRQMKMQTVLSRVSPLFIFPS